jgi:hypothetical protein
VSFTPVITVAAMVVAMMAKVASPPASHGDDEPDEARSADGESDHVFQSSWLIGRWRPGVKGRASAV